MRNSMFFPAGRLMAVMGSILLVAAQPAILSAESTGGRGLLLTPDEKSELHAALASLHNEYDPAERMLRRPFSSPGYHTTLKGGMVHPTRNSLQYAVALLDTGEETNRVRAVEILRRVIALQDQDPSSRTYGIWSWFLEESLSQMSPPDWNWADFCGAALVQIALDHRARLPDDVAAAVTGSIRHAGRAIKKRNVGPGYTNIAIMGAYVTLVAGELLDDAELRRYGQERWKRFYEFTKSNGGFSEYNSPTYTVVALQELGRLRLHVRDAEIQKEVAEVYHVAWEEIAAHFHAPTRQWAGPHSRCYQTLLRPEALSLIQRGTQGKANFGVSVARWDGPRLPLPCPEDLYDRFMGLSLPREVVKTFIPGERPVIGTTYLAPAFTLGTVNRGDYWNQRRSLLAYWGRADAPAYLQARFLHDGYDFAAAQHFALQKKGRVLGAVTFAVDGGDTHVSLDRLKGGKVRASDLRWRLECGGAVGKTQLRAPGQLSEPMRFELGGAHLDLVLLNAAFADLKPRWESGGEKGKVWLDLVFWQGEPREFDLAAMGAAAFGYGLQMSEAPREFAGWTTDTANEQLALKWEGMALSVPLRPMRASDLQKQVQFGF